MDKRTSVHRLIDRIDSGKISFENVKKQIDKIEQEFGALDLLYDVGKRLQTVGLYERHGGR